MLMFMLNISVANLIGTQDMNLYGVCPYKTVFGRMIFSHIV